MKNYSAITDYTLKATVCNLIILASILLLTQCAHACSRDVDALTPEMRTLTLELLDKAQAHGINAMIICTYRTQQEQDAIWAQGRTQQGKKITWTRHSRHTDRQAVDIVLLHPDGELNWRGADYEPLGLIGESLGLTWGGRWAVRDYGHFEVKR